MSQVVEAEVFNLSRFADLFKGIVDGHFADPITPLRIPLKSAPIPKQIGICSDAKRQSEKSERSDAGNLFIA
jgi:hypothetical protein